MLYPVLHRSIQVLFRTALVLTTLVAASCATSPQDPIVTQGEAFATPQAAVDAAIAALRTDDYATLSKIFGVDAEMVIGSGDEVADKSDIAEFLRKYDQTHRLVENEGGSMTLEVGETNWPMAFPLIHGAEGWTFDTASGIEELNARRVGRNELDCIQTCRAIADAQAEYLAMNADGGTPPAYAQRFLSDPGTRNGLFWPTAAGEAPSPLGDLAAQASAEGYRKNEDGQPHPYHGYFYRILTEQGPFAPGGSFSYLENGRMTRGFAVIAFPAQYGGSGIMTFIISSQGIVYQRDLGPDTVSIARSISSFNPDPDWTLAK